MSGIAVILGGIGMFLFGMKIMTDALREAAGSQLRHLLARFTTTPLAGVVTGAAATAVVQSSSATTVMTIGFVGAGLMTFPQALGVIYGANIGTTVTGWMVTLLGFKLQLGTVALPSLFGASLLALLGGGRWARIGRAASGLCLLFIGLDMMQAGAAGFGEGLTPQSFPESGLIGQLKLAAIGLAVTVVMQSSSAAMAMALVLLGSGSVSLEQAAAMVIGMNLGTTVTGLLATLGGSLTMRQTALANLIFNIGKALMAFPILGFGFALLAKTAGIVGEMSALVIFHTVINVVAAAVFLPFTAAFARFVERLIVAPAGAKAAPDLTVALDPALLSDEGAAMDAAQTAASKVARHVFGALGRALTPQSDMRGLATLEQTAVPALAEIKSYLTRISLPEDKPAERLRYAAILHQTDHLDRLLNRLQRRSMVAGVLSDSTLSRPAQVLGATLRRAADVQQHGLEAHRLARLSSRIEARTKNHRRATLLHEHVGLITVAEMFERTDAMRWLRRVAEHAARIAFYAEGMPGLPKDAGHLPKQARTPDNPEPQA
ncbi:MAG: Na/Pi cotransporter family protein [Rhodobacterales bacterium]